jgi:transcriptional regulator with XRE-family HTH domain
MLEHVEQETVNINAYGVKREHGDYILYSNGCRCHPCRVAWAEYRKNYRRRLRARGMSDKRGGRVTVDATNARRLALCLLSFGVSRRRLARAMNCDKGTVQFLEKGQSKHVRPETEEALESLHHGLWRSHPRFRVGCDCAVPQGVASDVFGEAS